MMPERIFLVGMMGVGKSTVGPALAARLQRGFVDSDALVEAMTGMSVREVFAQHGEPTFRALERRALADITETPDPIVAACGGGVVIDSENRRRMRGAGVVVLLTGSTETVLARLGDDAERPLLQPDPHTALERIAETRQPAYEAAAHLTVATDNCTVEEVVDRIIAACADFEDDARAPEVAEARRVRVALGARSYDVLIGANTLRHIGALVPDRRRVAVISQPAVAVEYGDIVLESIRSAGPTAELFVMGEGESAKALATVEELAGIVARFGLHRSDAIVALGGGIVGDTAGFLAATFMRGIDVIQVPTTLLAQVDAAIGGKTAVNLPEGKNLLGAFHQPRAVVCDPATLRTLPDREYRAGLGEVFKYALLGDHELESLITTVPEDLVNRNASVMTEVIARCARAKAAIVELDEYERTGRRATLNLGHTLAHALESAGDYALLHGEAVAVGCVYAYGVAAGLGRVSVDEVERVRGMATSLGLPTAATIADPSALLEFMRRDKKAIDGFTFVLPGPDGVAVVHDVPEPVVVAAFELVGMGG